MKLPRTLDVDKQTPPKACVPFRVRIIPGAKTAGDRGVSDTLRVVKSISHYLFLLVALGALVGCERKVVIIEAPDREITLPSEPSSAPVGAPLKTLETMKLSAAIDAFEKAHSPENAADVKKAFADLDGEIAELEGRVARVDGAERKEAAIKLPALQTYRDTERARYAKAQTGVAEEKRPVSGIDPRTGAEKAADSAVRAGRTIEKGAKRLGDAIEDVVKDAAR